MRLKDRKSERKIETERQKDSGKKNDIQDEKEMLSAIENEK